jgi:hypothetical protein
MGCQYSKDVFDFPFSSTALVCYKLATLLKPQEYKETGALSFSPATSLPIEAGEPPLPTELEGFCKWTNGHLLYLARLVRGETAQSLLNEVVLPMSKWFEKPSAFSFYLALLKMFRRKERTVTCSSCDLRFVNKHGQVLSPMFLQAFALSLAGGPPPPDFYLVSNYQALNGNPCEKGFALERLCLRDEVLIASASAIFAKLQIVFISLQPTRIIYRDFGDIVETVRRLQTSTSPWILHALPLKWNEASIDGEHLYFDGKQLIVVAISISVQTVAEHL